MSLDRTIRVGAAQTFPELFDRRGTIQKIKDWLASAAAHDLDLVVFPETFLSAYPYWRGRESMEESVDYIGLMQESAIEIPSDEVDELCLAANNCGVNCIVGANELDRQAGSFTLYNSQLFISRNGFLVASRRKLMPTHSERVYWGWGGKKDILACDFDIGRIGGLICSEHHIGLLDAAMGLFGEEIHCAVWPGWWKITRHLGDKRPSTEIGSCDIDAITRAYAIQNGAFVVSCCPFAPPSVCKGRWASVYTNHVAVGGSSIINPSGVYAVPPTFGEERLVHAEIDTQERRLAKGFFDACGHYSRYDLLGLSRHDEILHNVFADPGRVETEK